MPLLRYDQALKTVVEHATPLDVLRIPLSAAAGRHIAQDVVSKVDLPRFDNSQMDGYAVRSEDLELATADRPVLLAATMTSAAGQSDEVTLLSGQAVRIFTGAPIPKGADSVVPIEDVTLLRESESVSFREPVRQGQFIRRAAEDVGVGDLLIPAGRALNAGELALLASSGNSTALVYRQARVAILTNGDELVRAEIDNQKLKYGQIYESNALMLATLAKQCNAAVVGAFSTKDSREAMRGQLHKIMEDSAPDLIISTGGVSVGDHDYIRSVVEEIGQIVFWRAAIRPGKPIVYGRIQNAHFLGLPGNPASTLVTFELFARPLLSKLQGGPGKVNIRRTVLSKSVSHDAGRRSFVRARTVLTEDGLISTPVSGQGSHFVTSLAGANSLIVVGEDVTEIVAGSAAECILLGHFLDD